MDMNQTLHVFRNPSGSRAAEREGQQHATKSLYTQNKFTVKLLPKVFFIFALSHF